MRISSKEVSLLIMEYAKRKDIDDIKTIIRGKFTGADEKSIINSITAAGTLSPDHLAFLLKMDTIEDILKNNKIVKFSLLKEGLDDLKEKNTLIGIENALDKFYYNHLISFSKNLPKQGKLFRDFLMLQKKLIAV